MFHSSTCVIVWPSARPHHGWRRNAQQLSGFTPSAFRRVMASDVCQKGAFARDYLPAKGAACVPTRQLCSLHPRLATTTSDGGGGLPFTLLQIRNRLAEG